MIQSRRLALYVSYFFAKLSIAWEYARAKRRARAHPAALLDKERPTIGEELKDKLHAK